MPERRENIPVFSYDSWLGGIFEVGGSMLFTDKGIPLITFTDPRMDRLVRFKDLVGGSCFEREKYNAWSARGEEAVQIAFQFEKCAPSRAAIISLFKEWGACNTTDRKAFAVCARGLNFPKDPVLNYGDLVTEPSFLAGVLEFRSSIYHYQHSERSKEEDRLSVRSRNLSLLTSLKKTFGGNLEVRKSNKKLGGEDSGIWLIGGQKYNLIKIFCKNYLLINLWV